MQNSAYKRFLPALFVVLLLCVAFSPHFALATSSSTPPTAPAYTSPNALSCASNIASCVIYGLSYVIDSALGVFISAGAWLINFGLGLDQNVVTSNTVQSGFSTTLAFANMGFVIGIIVVAIATILRRETYGIKKTLWKIIVMAIFVNFGLVIAAPVIGFSNSLSDYFAKQASGSHGDIGTALMVDFAPQGLMQPPSLSATVGVEKVLSDACHTLNPLNPLTSWWDNPLYAACSKAISYFSNNTINPTNAANDAIWQDILSLIFSCVFLGITAFTLFTIAILLIIRYIWLAFLLVILPLAWLTWIFPKFSKYFSQWWGEFIRWAFFPAISLFFVYLALLIVNVQAGGSLPPSLNIPGNPNTTSNSPDNPTASVMIATGQGTATLQIILNDLLLAGFCLGGLIAANSLGIKGADMAIEAGKSTSAAVGNYAKKQGTKAARAGFRKAGGEKVVEKMRSNNIPVLGRITSLAGRAMAPNLTNKSMVDEAKKKVPESGHDIKENLRGNMSMEERLAHIAKLVEKGEMTSDVMVGTKSIKDFMDGNAKVIKENYGMDHLGEDTDKTLGSSKEMRSAEKALSGLQVGTTEYQQAMLALANATRTFASKLKSPDIAKMNVDHVFGQNTAASRNLLSNIAQYNRSLITPIFSKASGDTKEALDSELKQIYRDYIASLQTGKQGSWQSNPGLVARFNEINQRLPELQKRLAAVQIDPKMNTDEQHQAIDRINDETNRLTKELNDMQDTYTAQLLNKRFNKDKLEKAIGNSVFQQATP